MRASSKYLVAVVLLAIFAVVFGLAGTVAPPLAEESGPAPQQESPSESVGHFTNPPSYDSGWVDITTKCGQYVTLNHGLNTTDVVVDVSGKVSLDPIGGAIEWTRTYGGASGDYARSVVKTSDGGYAIAGLTSSYGAGDADFWLVKTDSAGYVQWNGTYGGTYSDRAYSVVLADDGGYALVGYTYSYGVGTPTYRNFWLVKTDSAGNMQWSRAYTGPGSDDFAYSLVQTGDEGYALTGSTGSAAWLVKTDLAGNAQWNKTYGDAVVGDDFAYSLVETGDGGYALVGYTYSYGTGTPTASNSWLVKTDGVGNMEWSRAYGGVWNDFAYSVVETSDGGYALAGYTYFYASDAPNSNDFWLVKITGEMNVGHRRNFSGVNLIVGWSRTYGGASEDAVNSLIRTSDGGYALAGYTNSSGAGDADFWLVKTDSAGDLQWKKTYGGAYNDYAVSVVQTVDRGYALVGYTFSYGTGTPTYSNFWFVKTDSVGNMEWNRTFGGMGYDFASSVIQTSDGGYAMAGQLLSYSAPSWLLKTDIWGIPQWNKTYGTDAFAASVIETGDGGYALAGYTSPYGVSSNDFYLVKTDSVGTLQWNKTYGRAGSDVAHSVVQTSDGGYALAGYTNSSGAGGYDFWLVRTDAFGVTQWSRTYGGKSDDYAYSVVQTSDGGYALAGYTLSYGAGGGDFWLVKTDVEMGFTMTGLTKNTIILYRGKTDPYWNYIRVRIWLIKEPSWIYGDINMDGVVDNKDLYIIGRNYGKTFSLLSLGGIVAVAGLHTYKKRKQPR